MGSYYCDHCNGKMKKQSDSTYRCEKCGKKGTIQGMTESGSPVDESMFGF